MRSEIREIVCSTAFAGDVRRLANAALRSFSGASLDLKAEARQAAWLAALEAMDKYRVGGGAKPVSWIYWPVRNAVIGAVLGFERRAFAGCRRTRALNGATCSWSESRTSVPLTSWDPESLDVQVLLAGLTAREMGMLAEYYGEGRTLAEIGSAELRPVGRAEISRRLTRLRERLRATA